MTFDLPTFAQASDQPIFIGYDAAPPLRCPPPCGNVLVENYDPEIYLGIAFRCFRCGTIIESNKYDGSDLLPGVPVVVQGRGHLITGPVIHNHDQACMASSTVIAEEKLRWFPNTNPSDLDISPSGLTALGLKYNELTGSDWRDEARIALRHKSKASAERPFPWALHKLVTASETDPLAFDSDDDLKTALVWALQFSDAIETWGHHPRLTFFARGFKDHFHHTIFQLLTASIMFDANRRVTFSKEERKGKSNPDLYHRLSSKERLHIEVKAPRVLQDSKGPHPDYEKVIKRQIDKSTRQIREDSVGFLAIGANRLADSSPGLLSSYLNIQSVRNKMRDRTNLRGIYIISVSSVHFTSSGEGILPEKYANIGYEFVSIEN